jgi:hypothetical protein
VQDAFAVGAFFVGVRAQLEAGEFKCRIREPVPEGKEGVQGQPIIPFVSDVDVFTIEDAAAFGAVVEVCRVVF